MGNPQEFTTCPDIPRVGFDQPQEGFGASVPWSIQPRIGVDMSEDDPAYERALENLLRANNIPSPVNIQGAVEIDLEGDGKHEVVVAANWSEETWPVAFAGDYSVVAVLRLQDGGGYLAVPIVADFYPRETDLIYPDKYFIRELLDLNGDGILEVVVEGRHWEGTQTQVYEVGDNGGRLVLGVGCSESRGTIVYGP
jgi:hypothetical protein